MKGLRFLLTLITGMIVAVSAGAGQNGSSAGSNLDTPDATVHSTSVLVILDVVVTERGQPVLGLGQPDFHVFEDGLEQSVKVFEEHSAGQPHQPVKPPPLPPSTYSNFPDLPSGSAINVLLLDAMNTPLQDQTYVRKQMIDYLNDIPQHSYMAIFTLGSRLRLVQGFTAQLDSLLAALQGPKAIVASSSLLPDANDPTSANLSNAAADAGANAQTMDAIRQFQADTAVFQMDLRVRNTLNAMNQLADYLGVIPGRKNLIWLSGSFPLNLDPDSSLSNSFSVQREYAMELKETVGRLAAARVAVYPIDVRGLLNSSALDAANRNPGYAGVAQPSTASIAGPGTLGGNRRGGGRRVGINPGGGNASNPNSFATDAAKFMQQTAAEHATMQEIAQETGGLPFYDNNGIKEAIARVIENGAHYYTVVYVPANRKLDGKFRKIRVELANNVYQLAYRRGYFAGSPGSPVSVSPLTPAASMIQHGAPPSSRILFKVRVLPADDPSLAGLKSQPGPAGFLAGKLKGSLKRYWIDFAADVHQIEFALANDGLHHGAVEFVTIAYDREGKLLNVIDRTLKLNLQPDQYEKTQQTGLPAHEELDVPVGPFYLRFAVHDLSTGRLGTIEIPFKVEQTFNRSSAR